MSTRVKKQSFLTENLRFMFVYQEDKAIKCINMFLKAHRGASPKGIASSHLAKSNFLMKACL